MAETDNLNLAQLGQVSMGVRDLDRAVAFYRDKLGVRFLFQVPGMAFFDCAGVRLMLTLPLDESGESRGSVLYYKVDDIDKAFQVLKSRGVQSEGNPRKIADMDDHELWMTFFRDSEENMLALMEERPFA